LLLSATTGYQLRSFDEAAARLGIDLVFATDRCQELDDPWRDRAIPVRFYDDGRSLDGIAAAGPFAGVLAVGDRPAILAARVAERLGLPGNPPHAAAATASKLESRARMAAAGLPVPAYFSLPASEPGWRAASDPRIAFPCVLKPLGLSGSRGVIRADARDGFARAFDRIRALLSRADVRAARTGLDHDILVERFIEGREVAVEGVLTSGALQVFTIFDKPDPLDGPFFEETIYVTPTALDPATEDRISSSVQLAANALGLSHGPVHAECRIGPAGVSVLEVAARPIGGLCSRALRFDQDQSLELVLLRHAVGEDISRVRREATASAVMMIPIPKPGRLRGVDGEAAALDVPHVEAVHITAKIGQMLETLPEASSYLGFVFARAATSAQAETAVRQAHARLSFAVDSRVVIAGAGG
jgi:biotin carboxylase